MIKRNTKYNQEPEEKKNIISDVKNTLQAITSRLDEAED